MRARFVLAVVVFVPIAFAGSGSTSDPANDVRATGPGGVPLGLLCNDPRIDILDVDVTSSHGFYNMFNVTMRVADMARGPACGSSASVSTDLRLGTSRPEWIVVVDAGPIDMWLIDLGDAAGRCVVITPQAAGDTAYCSQTVTGNVLRWTVRAYEPFEPPLYDMRGLDASVTAWATERPCPAPTPSALSSCITFGDETQAFTVRI